MTPEQLATRLALRFRRSSSASRFTARRPRATSCRGCRTTTYLFCSSRSRWPSSTRSRRPSLSGIARGMRPPLMFTPTGLLESTDAFPIELLDIHQSRRICGVRICWPRCAWSTNTCALQVERELTGKLSSLRRSYLLTEGKPAAATDLMLRAVVHSGAVPRCVTAVSRRRSDQEA